MLSKFNGVLFLIQYEVFLEPLSNQKDILIFFFFLQQQLMPKFYIM